MTTPKKPGSRNKPAKAQAARITRKPPARSGPIRTSSHLPKDEPAKPNPPDPTQPGHPGHAGQPLGMTPHAHAEVDHDEGMINKAVADAVRTANHVFSETVAQGRIAANQFQHGEYNMRDVPVDVQILAKRMIGLARDLSETTLSILEQLLKQMMEAPKLAPPSLKGTVPPFPTGAPPSSSNGAPPTSSAPPSSHAGPPPPDGRALALTVRFANDARAKELPSPLWKPEAPTLPSDLTIAPMMPTHGKAKPITDVKFEADLDGRLIATVTIPDGQPAGVYAGIIVPKTSDIPLGILTIEVVQ